MAKARGTPRRNKPASFTGRIMVDTVRGVLRVRKWPKKRGTSKHPNNIYWVDWFRQANLLAKYADAASQRRAKEMTAGTPLYPRDVMLAAMRGRLYTFVDEDGWKWYPMAAIGDISESLDVLAQTVGSVLVRATDRWRAATSGAAGKVLTHQGPAAAPEWVSPSGGGGFLGGAFVDMSANQLIPKLVVTPLNFDQEQYDTAGIHDNVTNNSRLTVPVGFTRIQLFANIYFTSGGGGARQLRFYKNGTDFVGQCNNYQIASSGSPNLMNGSSSIVDVVPGDYFECAVYQTSSASLNIIAGIATSFSMHLIS